ncbi:hypothetical protein HPP92_017892 [Vanilla planifolia]|uniref:Reverse transcriptase domain-containing protein n=1 Tax=Vanilla planifolia TaxID=51239 RepID=A0A835UMC6_VANPL|nr:hypothetical protein HPP92_017892 [Vanilla planifolia]
MPKAWKDTLVVLIPKRQGASKPEHFRPISLCNVIYKIVARILAERLKGVLSEVIAREQGAFLPGRSISNNIFIAQEMEARMYSSSSKVGLMAVKVDMEQAYDSVRWQFIEEMMQLLGFPPTWCKWVLACITSPRFGILLNGDRVPWIEACRGLRQGCPLSPYLFTLVSEFFSMLTRKYENQALLGFRCTSNGPLISHLLYADDVIIYAPGLHKSVSVIKKMLHKFSKFAGLNVNHEKSRIFFSRGMKKKKMKLVSSKLGIPKGNTLSYLGIPIFKLFKKTDFNFLIQKIEHQIAKWRVRPLSLAGRILLIKAVLESFPNFVMSHCVVPRGVVE